MSKFVKLALVAGILAGAVATQASAESADVEDINGQFVNAPVVSTLSAIGSANGIDVGPDYR